MIATSKYDSNLAMGLGLIEETKVLLEFATPNIKAVDLYDQVLSSGVVPNVSAYRLRNIVVRCFARRYLVDEGKPAHYLRVLLPTFSSSEIVQLMFLYTCRANAILADFVRDVYWKKYEAASEFVSKNDAQDFIRRAIDDGKTPSRWAEGQIMRVGRYLTGCCTDYGLLGNRSSKGRRIIPYQIEARVSAYLVYELHFDGVGDNALLDHKDWKLFGLERQDVLEEIKRMSLKGLLIVQVAGEAIKISWKQQDMEAVCDVLTQG